MTASIFCYNLQPLFFTPGSNVVKKFVRKLRIFVISYSVCPWYAFQAYPNKQSSLVRKYVSQGQKNVYHWPLGMFNKTFHYSNLLLHGVSYFVYFYQPPFA